MNISIAEENVRKSLWGGNESDMEIHWERGYMVRISHASAGMRRSDELKTPYRDGTMHVIFEPVDFISRLAALVPLPRINLTRYHGVFAPNSQHRAHVTPGKRGKGKPSQHPDEAEPSTPFERRTAMVWAKRLKRFLILLSKPAPDVMTLSK